MSDFSNVIVIADDMTLRISLVEILQQGSFQTRAYGSAEAFMVGGAARSPSCFLLDFELPGVNAREFQAYLRSNWPGAPVIFLSQHATVAKVVDAIKSGAFDVIEQPFSPEELIAKVKAAIDQYSSQSASRLEQQALRDRIATLTAREREILDLVIEGISTKEMARRLNISPRTVEVHRSRIMRKMDMKTLRNTLRIVLALRGSSDSSAAAAVGRSQAANSVSVR